MLSGVYEIVNIVSGSRYVGSAINLKMRFRSHKHALRNHKKSPPKLQRAWDKYGEEAFQFNVLVECAPENTLEYEQLAIDAYKPEYNTRAEAKSNLGIRWSAETNAKKSARHNKHIVRGVLGSISSLARHFGVVPSATALHRHKHRGMTIEEAVTTPLVDKKEIGRRAAATHKLHGTHPAQRLETVNGVTGMLRDLVARFSTVSARCVRTRLQRGWTVEKAVLTPFVPVSEREFRSPSGMEQYKAKQVVVGDFVGCMEDAAKHFGVVSAVSIARRLARGWTDEEAVTTPVWRGKDRVVKAGKQYVVGGVTGSINDFSRKFGIPEPTIRWRFSQGWEVEAALTTPSAPKRKTHV